MFALRPALAIAVCSISLACHNSHDDDAARHVAVAHVSDSPAQAFDAPASADEPALVVEADEQPRASKATFAEGPDGSVSIATTSGALIMSLRHDSVVVAFSDSIRQAVQHKVKSDMNRDKKDVESALGQVIQGVVQKSVAATLSEVFDKARGFPVSALRDVEYEDGAIRFAFDKEPTWTFESIKTDHKPLLEQFRPSDAARFVGAVRARLRQS